MELNYESKFTLNFFLNETCKNAISIREFIDSINIELSDLITIKNIDHTTKISNIIIKKLKSLDVTQRTIHCTDKKRETIYIKNNNEWVKDNNSHDKLIFVIDEIANKYFMMIPESIEDPNNFYDVETLKTNVIHLVTL